MAQVSRARPGTAGLLVLMATTGALLAFGWQDGTPSKAFRNVGRMLLESREVPATALPAVATAVGLAHHLVLSALWGALLMLLVRRFRGPAFVFAVLVTSLLFVALNLWLIPPIFGVGYAVVTSLARAIPFALAIATALLVTPWASGVPEEHPAPAPFA
jgi:hypothetical protein